MQLLHQVRRMFFSVALTCSSVGFPLLSPAAEGASYLGFPLPIHHVFRDSHVLQWCTLAEVPFGETLCSHTFTKAVLLSPLNDLSALMGLT